MRIAFLLSTALLCSLCPQTSQAQQRWGTLSGQFTVTGQLPPTKKLQITKDNSYCDKYADELIDESLVVDKRGGLANLYIWIRTPRGSELPIHPQYQTDQPAVHIATHHCRFQPRAAALWAGHQTLKCTNQDPIGSTFALTTFNNPPSGSVIPVNRQIELKFQQPEILPAQMRCYIHPWKQAWVKIHDSPYIAITDEKGRFEMPDIPAGKWEFQLWHERTGYVIGRPEWEKGRFELEIRPGKNRLKQIRLDAELFAEQS